MHEAPKSGQRAFGINIGPVQSEPLGPPRLRALRDRFAGGEDWHASQRVAGSREVLRVAVCVSICDCDNYDGNADGASQSGGASCRLREMRVSP
jgi:hypothetical protein